MTNIGDVIAQLSDIRQRLAVAAVIAMRASADAEQAGGHFKEAAKGTDHSEIRAAIINAGVAGDKAAKVARQLEKARERFATYLNRISPGVGADEDASASEMPSGEQLLEESERRGRRADIAWRKSTKAAPDLEEGAKNLEAVGKAVFKAFRQQPTPPEAMTTGTVAREEAFTQERPASPANPVTAIVMSATAVAVMSKSIWNYVKETRQARKRDDDDPT